MELSEIFGMLITNVLCTTVISYSSFTFFIFLDENGKLTGVLRKFELQITQIFLFLRFLVLFNFRAYNFFVQNKQNKTSNFGFLMIFLKLELFLEENSTQKLEDLLGPRRN